MLNSLNPPSGFDFLAGNLAVIITAAVVVVLAALGFYAFRRIGPGTLAGMLGGSALVLLGALMTTMLSGSDDAALRRSVETRTAELTARAIAPGSALACLDAVANAEVENACERALFATPEAVAIAVAYIDAKISLLGASASLATRDPSYQPSFERMRRALEADRFGVVAHVLTTRGCTAAGCPDLKHLRNSGPILANMKAQTFDGFVSARASAWHLNDGAATAALPPASGAAPPAAATSAAATGAGRKFEFPSAASIPAVSIMNAEPSGPASAEPQNEPRAAAAPAKKPQGPSVRRSGSRDNVAREAQSAQPMSVLPPPPPPPPPPPAQSTAPAGAASAQTSGQR
jgi:hypothetical protein